MVNILVVDDSDLDRMMIESNLRISDAVIIAALNGNQALEKLREWQIDLVLTDLLMPRMDGVELVKEMRRHFPSIPVAVTTSADTTELTLAALKAGAANFIPKNNLPELLRPVVTRMLELSTPGDPVATFQPCVKTTHIELEVDNDPAKLRDIATFVSKLLAVLSPLPPMTRLRLVLAAEHALNNALYRGNLEIDGEYKLPFSNRSSDLKHQELVFSRSTAKPYMDRKMQVVLDIKATRFGMRVRDGGRGFDTSLAGSWKQLGARGIVLMKTFFDVVEYNQEGNDVQMIYVFDRDEHGHPRGAHTHSKPQSAAATINSGSTVPPAPPPANSPGAAQHAPPATKRKVARLTVVRTGKTIPLNEQKTVVGSRPGCNLELPKTGDVAPMQCLILAEPSGWVLVQLAPQHPTYINAHPIEGRVKLHHGDVINWGRSDFQFELVSES